MNFEDVFVNIQSPDAKKKADRWFEFLKENLFKFENIAKIDMGSQVPVIFDDFNNKFSIDFLNNKKNYLKKKSSIKSELISRALGGGRYGLQVFDLSAGLGIDSVFLAQLGYQVCAIERNPLIFLALNEALLATPDLPLKFVFSEATAFLKSTHLKTDVIYFDPMFPEKAKSALPRQEMVFFRGLVGSDDDAAEVIKAALSFNGVKRVVVKRPIKAPAILKPNSTIEGKLIRFDIYNGVQST